MASTNSGSCLCGAVQYQLLDAPEKCVICYCESCQKSTGSVCMANCLFKRENLEITHGQGALATYEDRATSSGQALQRSFCSICGSCLFVQNEISERNGIIAVTSGTINDRSGLQPTLEYWCQRRRSWLQPGGIEGSERRETQ
ncbi:hypothetical protein P175DRAFT_0533432 [Aspergillus ochraceoroseus IBT 24754]|uniref:CENP-V/GFA domain-containing protein n=2 Tax=Aspergillus subgen. Nidulantes TaxID=2720870 RepID=A0A0F8X9T2_9EURO|nr:uncharacterized protein P175DRAFT_0533432 [Aspergillus ochraceoroseus IBT 24754]KKK26310.1 hypothetical protein ARAM_001569 [Aspergillus rambellii]PTU20422.1 hypothetical protein P175DRAFT_0533432 [Aspergillus ochraceoroseus IBT 24754]